MATIEDISKLLTTFKAELKADMAELKAEMNSASAGLMYGLIIEAYLFAAPEHLKILEHQVGAVPS